MYKPIGLSSLMSRRYGWTGAGAEFTTEAAENRNDLRPQSCVFQSLRGDPTPLGNTLESGWRPSPSLPVVMVMKQRDVQTQRWGLPWWVLHRAAAVLLSSRAGDMLIPADGALKCNKHMICKSLWHKRDRNREIDFPIVGGLPPGMHFAVSSWNIVSSKLQRSWGLFFF